MYKILKYFEKGQSHAWTIACIKQLEYALLVECHNLTELDFLKIFSQEYDPKIGLAKFFKYETVSSVFAKND